MRLVVRHGNEDDSKRVAPIHLKFQVAATIDASDAEPVLFTCFRSFAFSLWHHRSASVGAEKLAPARQETDELKISSGPVHMLAS